MIVKKRVLILRLVLTTVMIACLMSFAAGLAEDERVSAFLEEQAKDQNSEWVQAILESGAREVSWEENTAVFKLRSFDPGLKELGSYEKAADQAAWRAGALENMSAWDLEVRLTFEEDGTVSSKQRKAAMNTIQQAAKNAKNAAGKKDFTTALADMLFPAPVPGKSAGAEALLNPEEDYRAFLAGQPDLFSTGSTEEWACLFYVQRNFQVDAKKGPHDIKLTWDGADPQTLLNQAYDDLTGTLAALPAGERPGEERLPGLWLNTLAQRAVAMKKGKVSTWTVRFDLDDLNAGKMPEAYIDYLSGYPAAETYQRMVAGVRALPEMASVPMPKSGVISQAKKGRAVTVRVPQDGRNTYVQLRDADTGVIQADAFLNPGKNASLKVPEGVYIVQYASGSTWYGMTDTFGPLGTYTASNEFTVAKKKWKLTAETEQDGIRLQAIAGESMAPTEDKSIRISGTLDTDIPLGEYPETNPVIPGVSSTTGLPSSGEAYTPLIMVLDNAEEAYPHWGVSQADIIFQVPNAGAGATKLLALFADHYPEQAGPVRSGRSSMLPAVLSFDAAFAFAGPPAIKGGQVDLLAMMNQFGMNRTHRIYNLLNNNGFHDRIEGGGSHSLSCFVAQIHENLLNRGTEFEQRPFLFTDDARTEGNTAHIIRVLHRGDDPKGNSNSASRAVFKYLPETGTYSRQNSSGLYTDRETGEEVTFANVIVLRVPFAYDRNYIYLNKHMVGSGSAEIFQSGKYVRGAWVRDEVDSRLVLVDADGSELRLLRGKTFIVITNDVTDVIYTE